MAWENESLPMGMLGESYSVRLLRKQIGNIKFSVEHVRTSCEDSPYRKKSVLGKVVALFYGRTNFAEMEVLGKLRSARFAGADTEVFVGYVGRAVLEVDGVALPLVGVQF